MLVIRFFSILSMVFGVLIILYPAILAYLVAIFFILLGIFGFSMASSFRSYIKIVK